MYNEKRRVVFEKEHLQLIIHDVDDDLGDRPKDKALVSNQGRESTYQKIYERFYRHNIVEDAKSYIKICEQSQNLQSISIPNEVMQQIGIHLCILPEADGFKHLIVCIDISLNGPKQKLLLISPYQLSQIFCMR